MRRMHPRLRAGLRGALHGTGALAFPDRCLLCAELLVEPLSGPACGGCLDSLPRIQDPCCPRCSLPYAPGVEPGLCGACRRGDRRFRRALAAFTYDDDVRRLVHAFKFGGRERLGAMLVRAAPPEWRAASGLEGYAAVVPVPLSRGRYRERGFNQAQRIARALARGTTTRVREGTLRKRSGRPPQAGLTGAGRRRNAAGAYRARLPEALRGRDLLLVDDVLTTGATADAAAGALVSAGARAVDVMVLARVE